MKDKLYEIQKLGAYLKKQRESMGIELKQVAEATKIRLEYLVALENGDFTKLPSPVYTKGFIRNYSLFLGLNPNITLAIYRRENEMVKKVVVRDVSSQAESFFQFKFSIERLFFVSLIIGAVLFFVFIISQFRNVVKKPLLELDAPIEVNQGENKVFETTQQTISLKGKSEIGAKVSMNEANIDTKNLDVFEIPNISLVPGENKFVFKSKNEFNITSELTIRVIRTVDDETNPDENKIDSTPSQIDEMTVEITIGPREANLYVEIDGEEKQNYVEAVGSVKKYTAKRSIIVQTPRPDSVSVKINGETFEVDSTREIEWILIDSQVLRKE